MKIVLLSWMVLLLIACHKENAKHEYELVLSFETGDVWMSKGRIFEKDKRYKKYEDELKKALDNFQVGKKDQLFISCFDGVGLLKYNDLLGGGGKVKNQFNSPVTFANNQTGEFIGQLTMEGSYSQHYREYKVENGTFQFYWSNAWAYGKQDTIIKGTWTLKRK